MSATGAADRFWAELQALYLAAGKPTLSRLVRLGLEQRPQISISDSTINGWLNRKAIPTGGKNERYLTAMLAFLQGKARSNAQYQPLSMAVWVRLLSEAQRQRAAGKRLGRPRRPADRAPDIPPASPSGAGPASASGAGSVQRAHGELHVELGSFPGRDDEPAVGAAGELTGRDGELATLARLVTEVAAGQGSSVLIEGEPGIGKSTLVRAALATGGDAGRQVFWSAGDELGQALPLLPLLEGLRVHELSASPRRNTIVRLLRGEVAADRGVDVSAALAEQLLALVTEQCAARPTILVLDDLQWADEATVALWSRLTRLVRQVPLLLIGMMRPVPQRDDRLALRRAPGVVRLRLSGLNGAAVAELVEALAGGKPGDELLRLADSAAGNPLYIVELMAALARSSSVSVTAAGAAELTSGPAPSSLSAAIADRLGFVSGPVREVLRAAALLGVEFAVPDLAIVLGRSLADLLPALDEARVAGVLAESGNSLGFRHPLIRAALYEEMPVPVRTAWHRAAGRALAEASAPEDRVARQLLRALTGPDSRAEPMDQWILDWLARSAELLIGRAPQVAVELLRQAVASPQASSAQHGWLMSKFAEALYCVGDAAGAEQVANRALPRATEPDLVVDLHWTLAACRMRAGQFAEARATVDQALASAGISARHRARLLVLAARTHLARGEADKAAPIAGAALAAGEEAGDNWAMGWALHVLSLVTAVQGQMTDALPLFDRALGVAQADPALTDLWLLLQINRAVTLGNLDRFEEAFAAAQQARHLADQVGMVNRLALAHSALGQLLFDTGRWAEAMTEVQALTEDLKEPGAACCDLGIAALICLHRGESTAARRHLAAAVSPAERIGNRMIGPLALARSLGLEQTGALPEALAALTGWLAGGIEELDEIENLLPDAVRLATQTGDMATAQTLTAHAAARADGSPVPHLQATALYCRAQVDHDPAALLAAAERYGEATRPLMSAKALEAAAGEFARAGDRNQGRATFSRAVDLYVSLGAAADAARLQSSAGYGSLPAC